METRYLFPGSFCPPTWGHLHTATKAAQLVPKLLVVCSRNPNKQDYWFSENECAKLWRSYNLPANVSITTFTELAKQDLGKVVLIRGIRHEQDMLDEWKVMELNFDRFGIDSYLHIMADPSYRQISSKEVRTRAQGLDLESLSQYVSPLVVSALLERVLSVNHLFLVVGKPAGGKSTLLRELTRLNHKNVHIEADRFNDALEPIIKETFPGRDIYDLAINNREELAQAIKSAWFNQLEEALRRVPAGSNIFVEAAYALQEDKRLFRHLGGKIIYVGCSEDTHYLRNTVRGTPKIAPFVQVIPGWEESKAIAESNRLEIVRLQTDGELSLTRRLAQVINASLEQATIPWQECFLAR